MANKKTSTRLSRHVALLRGINVGGKNKLPMKDLAALVESLGAEQVSTYIQSGNVVFSASAAVAKAMPAALADAILDAHGLTVPVVQRTAAAFRKAAASNPFIEQGAEPKTLHLGFLADRPTKAAAAKLDPERSPPDAIALVGRELYLHLPNGVARTKYANAYIDRTLGTISTVRNWRTVEKLLAML